jgi:hypothetical protein
VAALKTKPAMRKDDAGFQTTVRMTSRENGYSHFANPSRRGDRILAASLPVLWGLVALVIVVVVVTKLW